MTKSVHSNTKRWCKLLSINAARFFNLHLSLPFHPFILTLRLFSLLCPMSFFAVFIPFPGNFVLLKKHSWPPVVLFLLFCPSTQTSLAPDHKYETRFSFLRILDFLYALQVGFFVWKCAGFWVPLNKFSWFKHLLFFYALQLFYYFLIDIFYTRFMWFAHVITFSFNNHVYFTFGSVFYSPAQFIRDGHRIWKIHCFSHSIFLL